MTRSSIQGRSNLPGQLEIPDTGEHMRQHVAKLAAAPLKPLKAQLPADVGLFGDEALQADMCEIFGAE